MADVESYSVTAASNTGLFPEGQAPSTVNDGGRQVQADVKIANNRINGDITAGGTADALTATFSPVHSAHVAGRVLVITAAAANATTTPTFTLDGLAAKTITKNGGQALVAGDIYGAGHELILKDAGTYYELMNPATSVNIAGVTSTVAELNILDGVTATATELNVLDNDVTNIALNLNKGADIASATTTDIGAATGNFVDVTGTTTITGLGTVKAGTKRTLQFDGSLTLTYNATSLILPGNANIITNAGDIAEFISLGGGNWLCSNYIYRIKPSFSVHRNAVNQTYTTGIEKIQWTTEEFDTNSNFDNSTNYRFTPTVAGKYLLTAMIEVQTTAGADVYLYIYKNGTSIRQMFDNAENAAHPLTITCVVDANGTTDYFEVFYQIPGGSYADGNITKTRFDGCKID